MTAHVVDRLAGSTEAPASKIGEVLAVAVDPAVSFVGFGFVRADAAVELVERAFADDAHHGDVG